MKNTEIYDIWTKFIGKYKKLIVTNEELWNMWFEKVNKYIIDNKNIPTQHNKDQYIKTLGAWIGTQQKNYKSKINCMKNEKIYKQWTIFLGEKLTQRVSKVIQ